MRLSDLMFRPVPAYERFAREAMKRMQREAAQARRHYQRQRLAQWWSSSRDTVLLGAILAIAFGGVIVESAIAHRRDMRLVSFAQAQATLATQRAGALTELVLALVRSPASHRYNIRIVADGPDEAITQLERMRAALVDERGEAQP